MAFGASFIVASTKMVRPAISSTARARRPSRRRFSIVLVDPFGPIALTFLDSSVSGSREFAC
jgi:hypothetical protein